MVYAQKCLLQGTAAVDLCFLTVSKNNNSMYLYLGFLLSFVEKGFWSTFALNSSCYFKIISQLEQLKFKKSRCFVLQCNHLLFLIGDKSEFLTWVLF